MLTLKEGLLLEGEQLITKVCCSLREGTCPYKSELKNGNNEFLKDFNSLTVDQGARGKSGSMTQRSMIKE